MALLARYFGIKTFLIIVDLHYYLNQVVVFGNFFKQVAILRLEFLFYACFREDIVDYYIQRCLWYLV